MKGISSKYIKHFYFVFVFVLVVLIASIRSAPIYGKLDFLLLDSKRWWPEWQPMVVEVLEQGTRPVYTDPTTSLIFNGIFGQQTVIGRYHPTPMFVEAMDRLNTPIPQVVPWGAYTILLNVTPDVFLTAQKSSADSVEWAYPFRCVINLQSFTPTWVPVETNHWSTNFADSGWFYRYNGTSNSEMLIRLREQSPNNCMVFEKKEY